MPAKIDKRSLRVRDEFGRYIKLNEDETGDNLVNVTVHNPVKRIYQLLSDIKKHQETTFAFKFSIPLIALPVAFAVLFGLGGFQLGKVASPFCTPRFTPHTGKIMVTQVSVPQEEPVWKKLFFWLPEPAPIDRPLVVLESAQQTLTVKTNLNLRAFQGRDVLVAGEYTDCDQTVNLSSLQNITLLNQ